jgi:uncharacterized protein (TIGR02996 family)
LESLVSDEAAFLKALRENPKDDTVRLAYADWLDERDDPRAEYIRLRHQLAQLPRINELAEQFDPVWLAAVGAPEVSPWTRLPLRSGRWVSLPELRQWDVYEWWNGNGCIPIADNRRTVEGIVTDAKQKWAGREPYLIEPDERQWDHDDHEGWRCGLLPSIACVGRFTSIGEARDSSCNRSELVVVWFQRQMALPIDPAVRERIRAIDWDKHAVDYYQHW